MCCDSTGDFFQLAEIPLPEKFVDINIRAKTLCGARVCRQEMQLGAVAQNDGVAGQLEAEKLLRKFDDIAPENQRLRPAGRQKRLIIAGEDSVLERLKRCIPGGTNLARFEPNTVTVVLCVA